MYRKSQILRAVEASKSVPLIDGVRDSQECVDHYRLIDSTFILAEAEQRENPSRYDDSLVYWRTYCQWGLR